MAATDKVSGHEGAVSYGGNIPIIEWEFTEESDVKNVTDSSSTYDENIPAGFVRWAGSFTGWVLDGTDTPSVGGAATELTLVAETGLTFIGNAIITSKNVVLAIKGGEAVKFMCNFVGTGALAETNE